MFIIVGYFNFIIGYIIKKFKQQTVETGSPPSASPLPRGNQNGVWYIPFLRKGKRKPTITIKCINYDRCMCRVLQEHRVEDSEGFYEKAIQKDKLELSRQSGCYNASSRGSIILPKSTKAKKLLHIFGGSFAENYRKGSITN